MFQEPTKNVPMAASAIVLLVIGVYAVSTSQAKVEIDVEVGVGVQGSVATCAVAESASASSNDPSSSKSAMISPPKATKRRSHTIAARTTRIVSARAADGWREGRSNPKPRSS